MQLGFRTESLPVEAFHANLLDVCGSFDIEPVKNRGGSWGGVATTSIAGLTAALVATDAKRILRTAANISRDNNENCFLIMQHSGYALMIQDERQSMLLPGDFTLIDSARPSEFIFFGARSEQISLHLSRQELREEFGFAFEKGLSISSQDSIAIAIRAIMEQGLKSEITERGQAHLRQSLINLLGAHFFRAETDMPETALKAGNSHSSPLLARAIELIDRRYADFTFSSAALASELNATPKQLQRSFSDLSLTPSRYILGRRLEAARQRIARRNQKNANENISTIAFACGFSDLSYFNRRFREAFGTSPGNYLPQNHHEN